MLFSHSGCDQGNPLLGAFRESCTEQRQVCALKSANLKLVVQCMRGNTSERSEVCSKTGHIMAGDKREETAEEENEASADEIIEQDVAWRTFGDGAIRLNFSSMMPKYVLQDYAGPTERIFKCCMEVLVIDGCKWRSLMSSVKINSFVRLRSKMVIKCLADVEIFPRAWWYVYL